MNLGNDTDGHNNNQRENARSDIEETSTPKSADPLSSTQSENGDIQLSFSTDDVQNFTLNIFCKLRIFRKVYKTYGT